MSTTSVYIFSGRLNQHGHNPVYIDSAYVAVDDQVWFRGKINEKSNNDVSLVALLAPLIEELKEALGADLKHLQFLTSTTDLFDFLGNGDKAVFDESMKGVIDLLKKTRDIDGIKITRKVTIGDKDFANLILADSAGSLTLREYQLNGKSEYSSSYTNKEWKAGGKNRPALLGDKLIFNWDDNEVTENGVVIYTGAGHDKKSASKKNKLKDTKLQDSSFVYYTGNNNKLRHMGKYTVDERRNVVILKEPAVLIDKLIAQQLKEISHLHTRPMFLIRADVAYGGGVGNWIDKDDYSKMGVTLSGDLVRLGVKRDDISYVFNPPRMAFMIRDQLMENRDKLLAVLDGTTKGCITDITDYFFYTDNSGKKPVGKLLPDVADSNCMYVKVKDIKYSEGTFNTRLVLTTHTPSRDMLRAIARQNPNIKIVTYLSDQHEVTFALVVECDEGWLYYSSVYGSVHILKTASKRIREALGGKKNG